MWLNLNFNVSKYCLLYLKHWQNTELNERIAFFARMKSFEITSEKYNYTKLLNYLFWVFILVAVAISIQKLSQGERAFWGHIQSHYNNYVIFKTSFKHLLEGVNLYDLYEKEYGDFYKYSPTFAVLMAPFYYVPDWIGLVIWNLLNCLLLFYGISLLPQISSKVKFCILSFSIIELVTSIQNQQSNAMIAGLLLLAFICFEKQKIPLAALLIMLCFFIKLTGILACVLFLFYGKKWKFLLWSAVWVVILAALPLLFTSISNLGMQYQNWFKLLAEDHSQSYGVSIFGMVNKWFQIEPSKLGILIAGIILFLLPLIKMNSYKNYNFRLLYVCSLLIWIVIFNHKAESSSYIVAMIACSLWYFSFKRNEIDIILFSLAVLLISLSPTDIFPKVIRESFILPYALKALPAVMIWIKIQIELMTDYKNLKS